MPSSEPIDDAHNALFEQGIKIRREVAGDGYVDRSLKKHSSDFSRPLQERVTEVGWGGIWSWPGLDRKQRSLINLGMLCALNRSTELSVHVRGALRNGVSEAEIREALLQVGGHCGLPAAIEGFRVAERVIKEYKNGTGEQRERIKSKL
ncbi:CMD-domain-containing protein [Zopfia rhizophila CBS 207.26]|uniref:CMD-domain-containing protein n=1 Tax=Zopfia rhizophila CBS 207.26 TaxID=1314779 RepID=A0A6A6DDV7_9PEZI|nr:CMD-domain-containing protein [Zopfia rhizophila CBS 207.26]